MSDILVSARDHPADLARAIWTALQAGEEPRLKAIGAAAVNQAVKGIAVARGLTTPMGIDAVFRPCFEELPAGLLNDPTVGIVLVVSRR